MRNIFIIIGVLSIFSNATAENKTEAITNINEYSHFAETYYLDPKPELIDSAITFVGSSGMASVKNAKAGLLMSFSCLFSMYDSERKQKWIKTIARIKTSEKSLLTESINNKPSELLEKIPLSAVRNDMNWACFFITGDQKYLNDIVVALNHLQDRKDIELFLTAASAKWSLSSNARHHPKVKALIETLRTEGNAEMQTTAGDILTMSPKEIREETIGVIKSQRSKGVW